MNNNYRRTRGGWGFKKWHCSHLCRNWPTRGYDERPYPPSSGICTECLRLTDQRGWSSPWRI